MIMRAFDDDGEFFDGQSPEPLQHDPALGARLFNNWRFVPLDPRQCLDRTDAAHDLLAAPHMTRRRTSNVKSEPFNETLYFG
jgi:hypothetical protein